ncbi:retinol dehydrogenase 11-like [Ostrinia nubilalis]|uniref:retinol dehydrogenase 11-like n=1 Tax=Ostrinia nubilalis TaxID=29057 RepID=UPI00308242C9
MSSTFPRQLVLAFLAVKFIFIIIYETLTRGKGKCKCTTKLEGKVALVTGGNSGIGFETAKDLARRGATVVIASRNIEKSEAAVKDIIEATGNRNVFYKSLNLLKFSSIEKFADEFNKAYDRLDILVNNSGSSLAKQSLSEDGVEKVIQTNYVGPFLLTELLMDKLKASQPSRIVIVASVAHEFHDIDAEDVVGMKPAGVWTRYSNSKMYNILWAKALAKRLPKGVTANALHPGVVKTEIFNVLSIKVRNIVLWVIGTFFKNSEEGAQTTIHLCVAPSLEGVSGEYFEDCRMSAANRVTNDEKLVDKVWESTMTLVKDRLPKSL